MNSLLAPVAVRLYVEAMEKNYSQKKINPSPTTIQRLANLLTRGTEILIGTHSLGTEENAIRLYTALLESKPLVGEMADRVISAMTLVQEKNRLNQATFIELMDNPLKAKEISLQIIKRDHTLDRTLN